MLSFFSKIENRLIFLAFLLLVAVSAWSSNSNLTLRNAVGGFTPLEDVYRTTAPENWTDNFENGVTALKTSLLFHGYETAYEKLDIDPEHFQRLVIILSTILFASVLWLFSKTIFPAASNQVHLLCVMFGLATDVLNHNLARFASFAVLHTGQMYAPAAILAVLGFTCAFRKFWIFCFSSIGLAFCFHPTIGLMSGAVCCAMLLSEPGQLKFQNTWIGGLIGLLIAGAWYGSVIYPSLSGYEVMEFETWLNWARFGNFHWFPFSLDVFGSEHARRITPLLAIFILALTKLMSPNIPAPIKRMWYAATLSILIITIIGLLASYHPVSMSLIKLALHRSSMFLLLFSLPLALHLIVTDLKSEKPLNVFLAIILLLTPVIGFAPGFPFLFAVLRFGLEIKQNNHRLIIPLYSGGFIIASALAFFIVIPEINLTDTAIISSFKLMAGAGVIAGIIFFVRNNPLGVYTRYLTATVVFICLIFSVQSMVDSAHPARPKHKAYLDVQLWAKENTPPGTLFMIEPSRAYGWRDYSRRPSFGVLREWIHTSWLYRANEKAFNEGMRRARLLGIEPDKYLKRSLNSGKRSVGPEYRKLRRAARERYNAMDRKELAKLAEKEGIDFFVFDKNFKNNSRDNYLYPTAYENEYFFVYNPRVGSRYEMTTVAEESFSVSLPSQPLVSEKLRGKSGMEYGWVNVGWRGKILVGGCEDRPQVMRLEAGAPGPRYGEKPGHVLLLRPSAAHDEGIAIEAEAQLVEFACEIRTPTNTAGNVRLRLDATTPAGWDYGIGNRKITPGKEWENLSILARLDKKMTGIAPVLMWKPSNEGDILKLRNPKVNWIKFIDTSASSENRR